MTKALVCTTNSHVGPYSIIHRLFGDPDHYAYKLDNDTFARTLPIHMNRVEFHDYDFCHSVSIDYVTEKVYFGNNFLKRLEFGFLIRNSSTKTDSFHAAPDSNQVRKYLGTNI